MRRIAAAVVSLLSLAQILPGHPFGLAALALAGMVILLSVRGAGVSRLPEAASPVWVRALSLRRRAARLAFLRLRDPDAAGRTRPRAPTTAVTA
jgi:hypothetical protein